MSQIYHITTQTAWDAATEADGYTAQSLANEGFIHCSTLVQVVPVADNFYLDLSDPVLLCIEVDRLTPEVRWESPYHPDDGDIKHDGDLPGDLFPHVYGAINIDAVVQVLPLPKTASGTYALPDGLL